MRIISLSEIISRVRSNIGEIGLDDSFYQSDIESQNLSITIKAKVLEAINAVHISSDENLLSGIDFTCSNLKIDEQLIGRISLPFDFLRLVSIRLNSWSIYPKIITGSDSYYFFQQNKFSRSDFRRPTVVACNNGNERVLELYSAKSESDHISIANYIPIASWLSIENCNTQSVNDNIGVRVCKLIEQDAINLISNLVLSSIGDSRYLSENK